MRSKTRLLGVLALSLLIGVASRAEEPPPVLMDEQQVRLPRTGAGADPTAAATVVEASRFAGEAKDVAGLVATSPGVAVNDYGGLGQLATVSIRGSTADGVLVLLDGLAARHRLRWRRHLSSIPRGWIERIEVLRGPEGALYGAGALGGVVNVVTRRTAAGQWSAEGTAGSFGTGSLAADGAVAVLGGTLLMALSGDTTRGDFPYLYDPTPTLPGDPLEPRLRENAAAWRAGALARLSVPAGAGRFDAVLQASAGHRGLPGFAASPTPDDWQRDGRLMAAARYARAVAGTLTLGGRLTGRVDLLDVRVGDPVPDEQQGAALGAAVELGWAPPAGPALGATLHRGRVGRRARPPGRPHPLVDRRGISSALAVSCSSLLYVPTGETKILIRSNDSSGRAATWLMSNMNRIDVTPFKSVTPNSLTKTERVQMPAFSFIV